MLVQRPVVCVGLGNPGSQYEGTRHNVGAMVVDEFIRRTHGRFSVQKKLHSEICPVTYAGIRVIAAKPLTYMNESGRAVAQVNKFYSTSVDHIVVIHDELDLPLGTIRVKQGGGDGGHNGLRSLTSCLGSPNYFRIRAGIGRPTTYQDPADYVLKPFSKAEQNCLTEMIDHCITTFESLITRGLATTQNNVHGQLH